MSQTLLGHFDPDLWHRFKNSREKICPVLSNNFHQMSCMLDSFRWGLNRVTVTNPVAIDYDWLGISLRLKWVLF